MAASARERPDPSLAEFADRLLSWASESGRRGLPWQPDPGSRADPYRVWVSEIMLQQTQVRTMLPYFERFMARFPAVHALAASSQQEVLAHWSGLGYYARARNLHAAARAIVAAGGWPPSREAWQRLPGVGRSTAAAVVSVVWGQREAVLDGNVRRVLARQVCAEQPWGSAALAARLWPEAESRLPTDCARMPAYTQAMMDLGALVCLPQRPRCADCPVQTSCLAARSGRQADYPVPAVRRIRPRRHEHWALHLRGPEVLLQERPPEGIWGGLWCLPPLPGPPAAGRPWAELRHSFTHFELAAQVWAVPLQEGAQEGAQEGVSATEGFWVSIEAALRGPLPTPVRRLLTRLCGCGVQPT